MKLEKRRRQECQTANCGLDKKRCLVHYGNSCIRVNGKNIPVQGAPTEHRRFPEQATAFKPYFLSGIPEPEMEGDL